MRVSAVAEFPDVGVLHKYEAEVHVGCSRNVDGGSNLRRVVLGCALGPHQSGASPLLQWRTRGSHLVGFHARLSTDEAYQISRVNRLMVYTRGNGDGV